MDIVVAETIHNEVLTIDDTKFIDCTLIDCTLKYSGKPVIFEMTRLRRCRYVFSGDAKRFVDFLQLAGIIPAILPDVDDCPKAVN